MQASSSSQSLDAEIAFIQQKIRSAPTESNWRMGLFQRYCQAGRWQKALEQLQAYARMYPAGEPFAYAYRVALQQEQVREKVFRGELVAPLAQNAPEWLSVFAATLAGETKPGLSPGELREQALQLAPESAGTLDEQPFEWIADADARLGPVCEVILDGQYQWLAFEQIESIRVIEPSSACDLVWLSAGVKLWDDESKPALIPARYPVLDDWSDEHLRSTLTSWEEHGEGNWIGRGVKVLTTDAEEKSLLDIRRIEFKRR